MRYGWSLDKEVWDRIPLNLLNDECWRFVSFTVAESVAVPDVSGVYVICSSPPGAFCRRTPRGKNLFDSLYNAIYIGKTTELKRRFLEHCKIPKKEILIARKCYRRNLEFWFTRVDCDKLELVESLIIDCLGPPANRQSGVITAQLLKPVPAFK